MNFLSKFQKLLAASAADAILLTDVLTRRYAAGYNISDGLAAVSEHECCYWTDFRYTEDAERNLEGFRVMAVDREVSYLQRLKEFIARNDVKSLGIEESAVSAGDYCRYRDELNVELIPMQKEISALRAVKAQWELDHIIEAQRITDRAFSSVLEIIRPGMTERQLRAELICLLYRCGAEGPSFSPIVISGPNTSLPHGVAGDRVLQKGDFVTMDFGCRISGYCSDMTRTVALGAADDEMRLVYETVLRAQLAGLEATKAGVTGCSVDAAARKVIADAGFGEHFGHGYGHGIGLAVHEQPNCSPSWKEPLPAGCICSAEPGIYLPGKFGVRIEDMVFVKENGVLNLTASPKNLIIV